MFWSVQDILGFSVYIPMSQESSPVPGIRGWLLPLIFSDIPQKQSPTWTSQQLREQLSGVREGGRQDKVGKTGHGVSLNMAMETRFHLVPPGSLEHELLLRLGPIWG